MSNGDVNKIKNDWLRLEYEMCQIGYNSRDVITEDLFAKVIQVFSIFLTVMVAISAFVKISYGLHVFLCAIIGIAGLISKVALLIDLQSASSCKIVLRNRCVQIEDMHNDDNAMHYWKEIAERERYYEEGMYKRIFKKIRSNKIITSDIEGDLYIIATRILIIFWIGIVATMILFGDTFSMPSR